MRLKEDSLLHSNLQSFLGSELQPVQAFSRDDESNSLPAIIDRTNGQEHASHACAGVASNGPSQVKMLETHLLGVSDDLGLNLARQPVAL